MTGSAFTQGMPARLKILGLPTFYALFCRLTGCPAVYTVYRIMPLVTFVLAYVVYGLWARFLFPKDYKKQITFLLVIALLFQFGCYGTVSDGARLFTAGWRGETEKRRASVYSGGSLHGLDSLRSRTGAAYDGYRGSDTLCQQQKTYAPQAEF